MRYDNQYLENSVYKGKLSLQNHHLSSVGCVGMLYVVGSTWKYLSARKYHISSPYSEYIYMI